MKRTVWAIPYTSEASKVRSIFVCTKKDYEQYIKLGIPLDQTETKNRFEIRLKNDRAYYAIQDLLKGRSIESTTFSIINRYLRFADKVEGKRRTNWPLNEQWGRFYWTESQRDSTYFRTETVYH